MLVVDDAVADEKKSGKTLIHSCNLLASLASSPINSNWVVAAILGCNYV